MLKLKCFGGTKQPNISSTGNTLSNSEIIGMNMITYSLLYKAVNQISHGINSSIREILFSLPPSSHA